MPVQAELGLILRNQQEANHETIIRHTTCDQPYVLEFKNYVDWVKAQPGLVTTTLSDTQQH
jgi:hypothetical protein